MKKLLPVLIFAAAFGTLSAQNEYFQHNPEWTVLEDHGSSSCRTKDTVTYYLNGDTLINSITYKKIYAKGTSEMIWYGPGPNMNCPPGPFNFPNTGYTGCIRSDSLRVYYILSGFTNEDLLYDFDLAVGDTIPFSNWTTNYYNETVAFIDSQYTPYGYLKKFHLSSDTSYFIAEGAFSKNGLYHFVGITLNGTAQLLCYTLNDTAWYPQQGPNCDAVLLSAPTVMQPEIHLQLVPNPASDFVDVQLTGGSIELIEVYDALGQKVRSQVSSRLSTTELRTGIYTVRITSGENLFVEKLLIE
jgi:hypothetical protein